jgi:hypothetical protein
MANAFSKRRLQIVKFREKILHRILHSVWAPVTKIFLLIRINLLLSGNKKQFVLMLTSTCDAATKIGHPHVQPQSRTNISRGRSLKATVETSHRFSPSYRCLGEGFKYLNGAMSNFTSKRPSSPPEAQFLQKILKSFQ